MIWNQMLLKLSDMSRLKSFQKLNKILKNGEFVRKKTKIYYVISILLYGMSAGQLSHSQGENYRGNRNVFLQEDTKKSPNGTNKHLGSLKYNENRRNASTKNHEKIADFHGARNEGWLID